MKDHPTYSEQRSMRHRASLTQGEIGIIMDRVDEYLTLQPVLRAMQSTTGSTTVDLNELDRRLRRLRQMRAPLFVVGGYAPGDLLRRLLNLPIALFGHKQRSFNDELLSTLDIALEALRDLQLQVGRHDQELREMRATLSRSHLLSDSSSDTGE
jgi:hypothetical protein